MTKGRYYPAYMLALLFVANMVSLIDRAILGIVTNPVKHELHLTDTQMSLVSGVAFALCHLVAGIGISGWVDRGNRRTILVLGVSLWSLATAATGYASGFLPLLLARIGVGAGEATVFPVAMSLIADAFVSDRRPRAVSVFQISTVAGVVAGSILAGVIAQHHGWRAAFLALGLAGLPLALLIRLTLPLPERGEHDPADPANLSADTPPPPLSQALALIVRLPGFVWLALGYGVAALSIVVLPIWGPAFLQRSHGVSLEHVGTLVGPAAGLGGMTGIILSGLIATALVRRTGRPSSGLIVPTLAVPLSAPFFAAFLFLGQPAQAAVALGIANAFLSSIFGPCVALGISLTPRHVRAQGAMLLLLAQTLIAGMLGPFLVGLFSDWLAPEFGSESLRYALLISVGMPLLAPLFFALSLRRVRGHETPGNRAVGIQQ